MCRYFYELTLSKFFWREVPLDLSYESVLMQRQHRLLLSPHAPQNFGLKVVDCTSRLNALLRRKEFGKLGSLCVGPINYTKATFRNITT